MRLILGRILSTFLTAGGWLLAGAKLVLDIVGYSTIPDDIGTAQTRLAQLLDWIFALPWWSVWGFALVSTLWLIWVSWPRAAKALYPVSARGHEDAESGADPDSPDDFPAQYDELIRFFIKYVAPVVYAHRRLEEEILSVGIHSKPARERAIQGMSGDSLYKSFMLAESPMTWSPASRPSFTTLTTAIHNVEFSYQSAINERVELETSLGLHASSDERLFVLWEDWRNKHNALLARYDDIKGDQRFGILFRPFRESKWGNVIPPAS